MEKCNRTIRDYGTYLPEFLDGHGLADYPEDAENCETESCQPPRQRDEENLVHVHSYFLTE
jgi:hypothetical protein